MRYDSRKAADGKTFVARLIGKAVAISTSSHPPKTTNNIVDQGKVKVVPWSSQKATYSALWKPMAIATPLIIPRTATQETSVTNDNMTIDFR